MKLKFDDDFDLKKIADSGQCFRFNECGDGFSLVAQDKYLFIKKTGEHDYEADCDQAEFDGFWRNYFDLDTDYSKIRGLIDRADDEYLFCASEFGNPEGKDIYSFPTPAQLSKLSVSELSGCSLGYRDKYVYRAAQDVVSGAVKLKDLESLDDEGLMQALLGLYGVGVKVANCEILFGYHRLDAFPKDVWINRVLEQHYAGGFPFERYAPYNGVMQQYLFFYSRSMQ